jgi:hypothetical protein
MPSGQNRSSLVTLLRWLSKLLPGDYLKTTFYLNVIAKPRKALRLFVNSFYRMDHIYEVLKEVKNKYEGKFSILEFGTANGYSFTKMLYATKYFHMDDIITVHAFDSFEGLPAPTDSKDRGLASSNWEEGEFRGNYQELEQYCSQNYKNYQIHKGYFEKTLTDQFLNHLKTHLPILVWIDCDYYVSSKTVFERLIPFLPNGCVIYFDDYEFNFGSRFTGEARIVHEINNGLFGDDIELVLDQNLSLNSNRVYRFICYNSAIQYERIPTVRDWTGEARRRTNDSPMP